MSNSLLVRVYDVGFGDCTYVKVPDGERDFHMLIDCGTSDPAKPLLDNVVKHLVSELPEDPDDDAKKLLDLVVVTHPHADHIKGFDPVWFADVNFRHIWLSALMKDDHPQAKKSMALQALTDATAKSLLRRGLGLSPDQQALLMRGICNTSALKALRETFPTRNGIDPLYVSRDVGHKLSSESRGKHKVKYTQRTTVLDDFDDETTRLRVLAPEWDIDGNYYGEEAPSCGYDPLMGFNELTVVPVAAVPVEGRIRRRPANISARDFRVLRERLLYSGLAFSTKDSDIKNNTSVVLLLEWRGLRLLFTGDAEWKGKKVRRGRHNAAWDVMLEQDTQYAHLGEPLDFIKIGHHGSVNGSPYRDEPEADQPILDTLLPKNGNAKVAVSTRPGKHGEIKKVPYSPLMQELGLRCANACTFPGDPEIPDVRQPQRTDNPPVKIENGVGYIEMTFPAPGD